MKANLNSAVLVLVGIISITAQAQAQHTSHIAADHIMVMPGSIKWVDAPSSLPPGAKAAVIEGDPGAPSMFTMRLKIPANFIIMPHTHPADEHVTVLEGECYMGLGDKYDEKAAAQMPTGAFAMMKTGTVHYFFTKKPCVIQLHGIGPWGITYINPAHDPRNKK